MAGPQNSYGGIDEATVQTKYPFHQELGSHIVVIENWIGRDTRERGFCDFTDWVVVKTIHGDASAVGSKRSRMRMMMREGSASEVKQRAQVALSSAAQAKNPGFEFPVQSVTKEILGNIVGQAGKNVAGYPIKIQVDQVQTKAKTPFTAIVYSVPTATDLEGLRLDAEGRVVG